MDDRYNNYLGKQVQSKLDEENITNIETFETSEYFAALNRINDVPFVNDKKRLIYTLLSPTRKFDELLPTQFLSIRNMMVEELTSTDWIRDILNIITTFYKMRIEWEERSNVCYNTATKQYVCNKRELENHTMNECSYCGNYFHPECSLINKNVCTACYEVYIRTRSQYVDRIDIFRLWLDILTKLTNVHNRMQVTTQLRKPSASKVSYKLVSKLINRGGRDKDTYCLDRLFFMDKVGLNSNVSQKMPIVVPLGSFLSFFYVMYITYVSIPNKRAFVFDDMSSSNEIKRWNPYTKHNDQDKNIFMIFMEEKLGVPEWIINRQHLLRTIGTCALATYHHFNRTILENIAHLSRHSVDELIHSYLPWYDFMREYEHEDEYYYYNIDINTKDLVGIEDAKVHAYNNIVSLHADAAPLPITSMTYEEMAHYVETNKDKNPWPSTFEPVDVIGHWDLKSFRLQVMDNIIPRCIECKSKLEYARSVRFYDGYMYMILQCPNEKQLRSRKLYIIRHKAPSRTWTKDILFEWIRNTGQDDEKEDGNREREEKEEKEEKEEVDDEERRRRSYISECVENRTHEYSTNRNSMYVGIDLSRNCVSVCIWHASKKYIRYFVKSGHKVGHEVSSHTNVLDIMGETVPGDISTYTDKIIDYINQFDKNTITTIYVAMEGAIDRKNTNRIKSFSSKHADLVHTVYNGLSSQPKYHVHAFDPSRISAAWGRKFATQFDDFQIESPIKEQIQVFTKRKLPKLKKYTYWILRNLPLIDGIDMNKLITAFDDENGNGAIQSDIIRSISGHPNSDIMDSFIITKYLRDYLIIVNNISV